MADVPDPEPLLAAAAALILVGVLASKVSAKLGVPALLLFLGIGMLAGSDGLGGIHFDDFHMAQSVGIVALAFPGVGEAETIFDTVFFITLTSVLVQGTTIPLIARWLSVDAPLPARPSYPLEAVFSDADTSLHELTIPADSPVVGRQLVELGLPAGALVVLLSRDGEFVVPQGGTVLRGGDEALVLADAETLPRVRTALDGSGSRDQPPC